MIALGDWYIHPHIHNHGCSFTTHTIAAVLCLRAQLCIRRSSRDWIWACRLDAGQGKKEAGQKHLLRRPCEAVEGFEDIRKEGYAAMLRLSMATRHDS